MRALLLSGLGVACACGGLDNRPLVVGSVRGVAAGCDGDAVVGVVGDTSVQVRPDEACVFRIDGLDPGAYELFVAPTKNKVTLVPVQIAATKLADVGDVDARPGAFVRVRVSAPGSVELEGEVTAPDLPLAAAAIGRSGMARIGPFPAGCFRLDVTMKQLGKKSATSCVAEGDERDVDVTY
ncbi:MAG: hypothetical protein JNK82_16865 [Myxococcaceae bacterium]|nr:hypothetical protein [Myxococcaceae bacterium]